MTASEVLTADMKSTTNKIVVPAESLTATAAVTKNFIEKVPDRRLTEVVAISFSDWFLP